MYCNSFCGPSSFHRPPALNVLPRIHSRFTPKVTIMEPVRWDSRFVMHNLFETRFDRKCRIRRVLWYSV